MQPKEIMVLNGGKVHNEPSIGCKVGDSADHKATQFAIVIERKQPEAADLD